MKKARVISAALLVIFLAAGGLQAAESPTKPVPSLEELIKGTGFAYTKLSEGNYKIVVDINNETSIVIANEANVGNQPETKLVYMYTPVVILPANAKPNTAMLRKMAELNDSLVVGRLSLGDGAIFYNSSCWMRNADEVTLVYELILAHKNRTDLQKMLKPFLEE